MSLVMDVKEATSILKGLAGLFAENPEARELAASFFAYGVGRGAPRDQLPSPDARYRTLVEQIPAVIFMAFLDRGISEAYVSPYIESVLGFSQKEWLDDPVRWYRQIHPEDKERWSFEAAQVLVSGQPLRSVYRVLARDGRVVWFQCEAKVVRNERGRPWFIHGLAIDITELKETQARLQRAHEEAQTRARELETANRQLRLQIVEREAAEKSLRESEERFRLLVEGAKDYALFMLDPDGYVASWNRGAERLKGYAADEIIGKHFSQFYLAEAVRKGVPAEALRIARSTGQYQGEGWRVRKDGSTFWANVLITALTDETGQLYGFAKLTRDMTEQKLIQDRLQESERLAAAGATAAVFAHEIGNPLNGISAYLQFLQLELAKKYPDPLLNETLDMVVKEMYRLGALLGEFRSLARPRQLDLSPTNLAQLVAEVLSVHAAEYAERGILVEQDFPPDLPVIMADAERLKQALLNLCKNAVEAMAGGGTLTIRGRQADGLVSVDISDTGVGIPEDVNIFQLFTTTKDHGTGLGLAIVRQIISAHRGTVSYRSTPGKGTTFTVSLPVQ
jgi:PAS domain S-box-containing protein